MMARVSRPLLTGLFFYALLLFDVAPVNAQAPSGPANWPQWRGPLRDGVSRETGLLKQWPKDGPPVAWEVDHIGMGYSTVAVKDGRIYTQGDLDGVEHVLCLNAKDGTVLWAVQPGPAAERLRQRIADALKRLDKDGDGRLDEAEALAELEWGNLGDYDQRGPGGSQSLARERAARLLQALDKDGDGRLSFQETRRGQGRLFPAFDTPDPAADAKVIAERRTKELFAAFDKDRDGKMTATEAAGSFVQHTFYDIDAKIAGTDAGDQLVTPAEVAVYLLKSAKGCDGVLTAAELADYFTRVWPGRDGALTVTELRSAYGGYRDEMGTGPRSTPTVDGDRVYALGCTGDLACLAAATGKTLWSVHLVHDLGGRYPRGYCESPLVEGDLVIVTPGGARGAVAALDKQTGRVVWRSTEVTDAAHYASAVAADLAGVRTIVQYANQGLFGLDARGGKLLWRYQRPGSNSPANVCTPVVFDDHVFAASAYNVGGGLARVVHDAKGWRAEEVFFAKRFTNHHGGVVLYDSHLYGTTNTHLLCVHARTGKIVWTDRSVGKGALVVAGGMLYLLSENHRAALAEATPAGYREHGRFAVEDLGRPTWSHPVVAGGRLYLRNQNKLTAYDLTDPEASKAKR